LSLEKAYANKDKNIMLLYFWMGIVTLSVVLSLLLFVNTRQWMFLFYLLFATATAIIITSTTGMITMMFDSDPNQFVTNYYQYGAVLLIVFMPRFINSLVPIFSMSPVLWKIVRTLGYAGIAIAILYCFPYFKFSFFFTRLFINLVVSFTAITFLYILITLLIASVKRKANAITLFGIYLVYLSLGFVNVILPLFGAIEGALNAIHFVLIGSALETIAFMIFMSQAALSVYKERQILLEQVRENQELVMKAIVKGQEDERNRFSRDLHDGFGQMISALNLNLKGLRSLKNTALPERMDAYNSSEEILRGMHDELKNICFNLMPQTLIKHGLDAAFSELAQRINASGEKHVEINIHGLPNRLDEIYEISIYRIAQEWINNILKYSDAQHITLQITCDEKELTLLIEDDGLGFDKTRLLESGGNGWRNIHSRANLISGEIELDTTVGMRGNTLILNSQLHSNATTRQKYLEEQSKLTTSLSPN
jgi:signal transduction histidine kinase